MLHEQTTTSALNGMEHRKPGGIPEYGSGSGLYLRARSQPDLSAAAYSPVKAQAHAQMMIDCIRKVMVNGQCAVVIIFPFAVLWVTQDSHLPLGVPADLEGLTLALEQKISTEDSIELAERLLRSARCAELGLPLNTMVQTSGSLKSQKFKIDIDCYFKDPDLHCAIALLTPGAQSPETSELRYEQAQLSSVRYHIGIISNTGNESVLSSGNPNQHYARSASDPDVATSASSRPAAVPKDYRESADALSCGNFQHMHDFIPSMTCREVEYFYSLLPAPTSASCLQQEHDAVHATSIMEQEEQITDPDHLDPHQRLRLLQSVPAVLPRRPRDLAEVQAETAAAAQRGLESRYYGGGSGFAGYHTSNSAAPSGPVYKKSSIKCLECGVDQSPEWRKGPMGPKTLCNRCGLRYAKKLRLQSK